MLPPRIERVFSPFLREDGWWHMGREPSRAYFSGWPTGMGTRVYGFMILGPRFHKLFFSPSIK